MISKPSDSSRGTEPYGSWCCHCQLDMNRRPVITLDPFSGEGCWDDWISHFDSIADVNGRDEAAKLLWLRVPRANCIQTLSCPRPPVRAILSALLIKGLQERFEPACKKDLYLTEFQARRKWKEEDWASFTEDLQVLADKAFPELQKKQRSTSPSRTFWDRLTTPRLPLE